MSPKTATGRVGLLIVSAYVRYGRSGASRGLEQVERGTDDGLGVDAVVRDIEGVELTIVYERVEGSRYQATIPAVPGTISVGRTRGEARSNVIDALRMVLTTLPESARGAQDTEHLQVTIGRARPRDHGRDIDR